MLAWGYRIKILLRCDFFRYDALRFCASTPKASFRNRMRPCEFDIRNPLRKKIMEQEGNLKGFLSKSIFLKHLIAKNRIELNFVKFTCWHGDTG
jgi:hypothetical protein